MQQQEILERLARIETAIAAPRREDLRSSKLPTSLGSVASLWTCGA